MIYGYIDRRNKEECSSYCYSHNLPLQTVTGVPADVNGMSIASYPDSHLHFFVVGVAEAHTAWSGQFWLSTHESKNISTVEKECFT